MALIYRGHFSRTYLRMKYQTEKGFSNIRMTVDRFEENKAVLSSDNNEEIVVLKRLLPKEAIEGSVLHLTIATDEAETKRRETTAKELLNEILNLD